MTSLSATTEAMPPARALTVTDVMLTEPKRCDPTTTVDDVRRLFVDDHVHAALIVDRRNLLTFVEREDIEGHLDAHALARDLGTLCGRVVRDDTELHEVHQTMLATGRRRLAVLDFHGRCVGLLCLKRSGNGFCTDDDVAARRCDEPATENHAS